MKNEQKRYRDMLSKAKIETVSNLVLVCGKDTKKLYKVMNGITSNNPSNPMPDTTDDEQLMEQFAEIFIGKIKKIHKALGSHPTYEPSDITMHCKI